MTHVWPLGFYNHDAKKGEFVTMTVSPYSLALQVSYAELYGIYYPIKDNMKLSDFKPGDLVRARSTTKTPWFDGVVATLCQGLNNQYRLTVNPAGPSVTWSCTPQTYDNDCQVGSHLERRYLYAIGEDVEVMETSRPLYTNSYITEWLTTRVSSHPSRSGGVNVFRLGGGETFFPYECIRKKPVETEQERLDRVTKPLHVEIERLKHEVASLKGRLNDMRSQYDDASKACESYRLGMVEARNNLKALLDAVDVARGR